ncbi:hypothetical protein Ssed_3001 [Shewanella sediminis HAW-EB3]|uniref:Glycosyltransferase 61 catalytic domain-containing protein n=1 Tax=Shewanella sediminis (strain HAW-EB3) TaxID=425104 RepID=A8FXN2_SHESH|nr:glycosyltransferase family 61 protein [Shewanella sediminis]ABV37605.1 hypothetical protein Ssed_3001 [Shewanella sediminis HAW-EB3]
MSNSEYLLSNLDDVISVNSSSLSELAQVIDKNLGFLNIAKSRTRIRPDPFLPPYGAKKFFNPIEKYDENMHLIAFLAKQAISNSRVNTQAYNLLASSLYNLNMMQQVIEVIECAEKYDISTTLLNELQSKATLELGIRETINQKFTQLGYENVEQFEHMQLSPFLSYKGWAKEISGKLITICDTKNTVSNIYRHAHQDFDDVKVHTNKISAEPLVGIQVKQLNILLGTIPFIDNKGLYELDLLHNHLKKQLVKVADTSLLYNPAQLDKYLFSGKYLISAVPNNYFTNYFHALIQVSSRILLTIENPEFDDHKILMPDNTPRWVIEFLILAGVTESRIDIMPTNGISTIEHATILPMNWDVCPNEIAASRRALLKNNSSLAGKKDYYLIRKDVQNYTRALVNEEEIIDACNQRGIEVIDPLDYTLPEQMQLFSNARTLISSGSSSITNMLFAGPETEIIILGPRLFWGMLFPDMAAACGHNFSVVFGDFIAGNNHTKNPHNLYVSDVKSFTTLLDEHICNKW